MDFPEVFCTPTPSIPQNVLALLTTFSLIYYTLRLVQWFPECLFVKRTPISSALSLQMHVFTVVFREETMIGPHPVHICGQVHTLQRQYIVSVWDVKLEICKTEAFVSFRRSHSTRCIWMICLKYANNLLQLRQHPRLHFIKVESLSDTFFVVVFQNHPELFIILHVL